jgi:hypothetical protein
MFDEQPGMYRMQALLNVLRAYKRTQDGSSMCLNGSVDEGRRVDKEQCGPLTMADAAAAAVAERRSPSERSLLMKKSRFFWNTKRQPSEQREEELIGGICDIRHSPNRIFKVPFV